jgi:hypothetical protein
MKKIITLFIFMNSMAFADVIQPTAVIVSGLEAKNIFTKIVEVTTQQPTVHRGREVVSANAQVLCYKSIDSSTDYICQVSIQK